VGKESEQLSQIKLNYIMKDVEFYKIQNGVYPESLEQIKKNVFGWIDDPIQSRKGNGINTRFNYKKVGDKYYLFSSGIDGIPHTKDDLYPTFAKTDRSKFGLIKE